MKYIRPAAVLLLLLFIIVRILSAPSEMATTLREGVLSCTNHIIPALFAMMALSEILLRSGLYSLLGIPFRFVARHLFHQTESEFAIFLISQFAGYPVGIAMLSAAVRRGELSSERAARMSLYCFSSGPAFLVSLVGVQVYQEPLVGWMIYGANVCMNLLLALIPRGKKPECTAHSYSFDSFSCALVDGTRQASKNLFQICGLMLLMKMFHTAILPLIPAFVNGTYCAAVLEISRISDFARYQTANIPILAAFSAFGGICVLFQLRAVGGRMLRTGQFILARLVCAAGSYLFCYILTPILLQDYTAPTVSGTYRGTLIQKPALSVIVLMMTAMLLLEWHRIERKKAHCN